MTIYHSLISTIRCASKRKINNTPGNILKDYQPKGEEFDAHYKSAYGGELDPLLITPDKVGQY